MRNQSSGMKIGREGLGDAPHEDDVAFARWYHTTSGIFAATVLLSIILVMADGSTPWSNRLIGTTLVILLIAWFRFRGQWSDIHSDLDVVLYFAVLVTVLSAAISQHNGFALILFSAYWQGFAYLRIVPSLVYATILTLASQWAFGNLRSTSLRDIITSPTIVLIVFVALVVSGLLASYIETIEREAERRADLLKQLREAQQELAAREREAGVSLERQRLAGEIHDTVAQHFTSIVTNLEAAEARADVNPDAAKKHLYAARNAARQGIADARSMVHALQPEVLMGKSIGDALRQMASDATEDHGRINFREEGQPVSLDRLRETILVRALQESLNNERKHARATVIHVVLAWLDDEVILDIQDNGVGFNLEDIEKPAHGHRMGLTTMRQRVESAGGTWTIESSPGEGASLAVSFPIVRPPGEDEVE